MKPLDIPASEWQAAVGFFKKNPFVIKFRRKDSGLPHSFITVGNTIYSMANLHEEPSCLLGQGGFSRVKVVQNIDNEMYALRVQGASLETREDSFSDILLKKIDYLVGVTSRRSETQQPFYYKKGIFKQYSVERLIEGQSLFAALSEQQYNNVIERLIIAYYILLEVHELHETEKVLHCDLKSSNIMISGRGAAIKIKLIDFDFAQIIGLADEVIGAKKVGTPGYVAPEIVSLGLYSKKSESYALGSLLHLYKSEALLTKDYCSRDLMRLLDRTHSPKPDMRPSIVEIASAVLGHLIDIQAKTKNSDDLMIISDFLTKIRTQPTGLNSQMASILYRGSAVADSVFLAKRSKHAV